MVTASGTPKIGNGMIHAPDWVIYHTRRRIADIVRPDLTQEDLYWMRFRVGECYLMRQPITPEVLEELLRDATFWNWIQQVWFLNDIKIADQAAGEIWSHDDYEYAQENLLAKFKINRTILASARPPAAAQPQGHEHRSN